jgi:hypothetical protein
VASPSAKLARMSSGARIDPELKEFIDTLLVPMLVRDALCELANENRLASGERAVAKSPRSGNAQ